LSYSIKDEKMKKLLHGAMAFFCVIGTVACESGKQPALSDQSGAASVADVNNSDGSREIAIIPELPTPLTDLEALSELKDAVLRWEKNGKVIEGESTSRLLKSHFSKGDRIRITAHAGSREASAAVQIGNTPPVVKEATIGPHFIHRGIDITATPTGYDGDGDNISYFYRWSINGSEVGEHTEVLKGNQFKKGDKIVLTIVPSDSDGEGEVYTSVPLVIPNAPPRFTSEPAPFRSSRYEYNARAEDPDGDKVRYSLGAGPSGMAVEGDTGKVTWAISRENVGDHSVEIQAQDEANLTVTQKFTLTITPLEEQK
jgi:hypothetical protein